VTGSLHEHPCKFISQIPQLRKVLDNNGRENQSTYLMSNAVHNIESNKRTEVQEISL
jgi:hypothetical protein